ncbi:MAG TPA: S1 RNA-binding domain-containing protein [Candidatus Limnocylindrales bacterium]|nr:S1 RNA-binding domain-containing protein [Candidatus Limnocylindrales bacterium]
MAPNDPSDRSPQTGEEEDFATLFAASESKATAARIGIGDKVRGKVIAISQDNVFVAIGNKAEATIDAAEFRDSSTGEILIKVGDVIEATVVDDGSRSGAPVLRRVMGRGGANVAFELEQAFEHQVPIEGLVTGEVKGGFEVQIGSTRAFCPGSQIDRPGRGERVPGSQYIGRRFPFRVTKIEQGGRNVVVSRRDLLEEEAAAAAARTWERLRVGAVLTGTVTSVRDFGAFVDLGGVEGMIHISEMSHARVERASDLLSVGQTVEVQVIKVGETTDNRGRRQIGLSLKALAADPWTTLADRYPVGATVHGTVRRLETFGAFVEIEPGIEGLVHISKISTERRLNHARQALEVGQSVEVTVLSVDPEQRRLSLSMVETARKKQEAQQAEDRAEEERVMASLKQPGAMGTLGDLLAEARRKK